MSPDYLLDSLNQNIPSTYSRSLSYRRSRVCISSTCVSSFVYRVDCISIHWQSEWTLSHWVANLACAEAFSFAVFAMETWRICETVLELSRWRPDPPLLRGTDHRHVWTVVRHLDLRGTSGDRSHALSEHLPAHVSSAKTAEAARWTEVPHFYCIALLRETAKLFWPNPCALVCWVWANWVLCVFLNLRWAEG